LLFILCVVACSKILTEDTSNFVYFKGIIL
jgi:hypothetical protein